MTCRRLNLSLSAQRFQKRLPRRYRNALPFLPITWAGGLAITSLPILTPGVVQPLSRSPPSHPHRRERP